MADRITQQEHSVLAATLDWKAPYEVANALYPPTASITQRKKVAEALRTLHSDGLLEYGRQNNTYRRTDRGTAALGASIQKRA
jgi:hypothetical protein